MPPGPLRDRLLASARRLGFECSDFLVWNTRSGMANAMVVGVLPRPRYVIFTDRLLEEFAPEEVEAVLGHELGHVKHRHMLTYLLFLMVSMAVLWKLVTEALPRLLHWLDPGSGLAEGFQQLLNNPQYQQALPMALVLLPYIFVVFGYLSRRCERQADVFGCRAVSCRDPLCQGHGPAVELARGDALCPTGVRTFVGALEKVALLNGINRDRPGFLHWWQHGSIARRVGFLEGMLSRPGEEPAFQRGLAFVKWGLFAVLGTLLLVLSLTGWS
jgi:STE24 endopeptidase